MLRAGRWAIALTLSAALICGALAEDAQVSSPADRTTAPESLSDTAPAHNPTAPSASYLRLGEGLTPGVISGSTASAAVPASNKPAEPSEDADALATSPSPAPTNAPATTSALPAAPATAPTVEPEPPAAAATPPPAIVVTREPNSPTAAAAKRKPATATPGGRKLPSGAAASAKSAGRGSAHRQTPTRLIANGLDQTGGNIANVGSPDAATDLGLGN